MLMHGEIRASQWTLGITHLHTHTLVELTFLTITDGIAPLHSVLCVCVRVSQKFKSAVLVSVLQIYCETHPGRGSHSSLNRAVIMINRDEDCYIWYFCVAWYFFGVYLCMFSCMCVCAFLTLCVCVCGRVGKCVCVCVCVKEGFFRCVCVCVCDI